MFRAMRETFEHKSRSSTMLPQAHLASDAASDAAAAPLAPL
jgi:hypothetical protein